MSVMWAGVVNAEKIAGQRCTLELRGFFELWVWVFPRNKICKYSGNARRVIAFVV